MCGGGVHRGHRCRGGHAGIRAGGPAPTAFDLEAVVDVLDVAAPLVPDSVAAWYVDEAAGTVVIETTDTVPASTFAAAAGADTGLIEVRQVAETPQRYLAGGDAILNGGGRCSAGFNATDGSTNYVITAGHCTVGGGNWTTSGGALIGPGIDASFPVSDFGLIEVTNPAIPLPGSVTGLGTVSGSTPASVGAEVCRSGSTTGVHCGEIVAYGATVNYGGGDVVYDMVQTTACAEPGDSGGSWMAGSQAQGVTSGGSGNCTFGGTTYYQPLPEALNAYGLSLITG